MTLLPPAHEMTRNLALIRSARIRPVPTHQAWDDQGLGNIIMLGIIIMKAPHTVSHDGVASGTGSRFPSPNNLLGVPCPPCLSLCVGGVGFRVLADRAQSGRLGGSPWVWVL